MISSGDPLLVSEAWSSTYQDAHAGILVMQDVANPTRSATLDARKLELEKTIRERFAGADRATLRSHPVLAAYDAHYRRFEKTYHVRLQLESLLFKAKAIPSGAALVEAMFMAEMDTLLLTAGHDLEVVKAPLLLDVAQGSEEYTLLRGTSQLTKAGDMMITDREGVISSIVYGPDLRTQIRPQTTGVVFTVYAPRGIQPALIEAHLQNIKRNVELVAPEAHVVTLGIYPSS